MVFAGHETTSATLATTFCFLAAYPEEQKLVLEEIEAISRNSGLENDDLPFEYSSFIKTRSAFLESLRMMPSANLMIRETREDTILQVPVTLPDGTTVEKSMAIPKDTTLIMDLVGLREFYICQVLND
jgi:cytochrome P450